MRTAMSAAFPLRLRFVFPHACTKRKEKFGFRSWCRDRGVVPAGLDASASRRTGKPAYRLRQNYVVVSLAIC